MGNNILKTKRVRKIIESLSHIHQRFTNFNVFFFLKSEEQNLGILEHAYREPEGVAHSMICRRAVAIYYPLVTKGEGIEKPGSQLLSSWPALPQRAITILTSLPAFFPCSHPMQHQQGTGHAIGAVRTAFISHKYTKCKEEKFAILVTGTCMLMVKLISYLS